MKPICAPCRRFFKPKTNGFNFTEGMPKPGTSSPKPGLLECESWQPYKLWSGDLWQCPGCKAEIIVGIGLEPVRVQHEPDFWHLHAESFHQFQVNDC